ncbi:MAG: radical SAM protein [Candidatus Omnitrophica bacterium]|nr:radical SAM protein [Candidatus Omnitrophota bacterium]
MNHIRKITLDPILIYERARQAAAQTSPCRLCPHHCGVLRSEGEKGNCGIADAVLVSSVMPHHGEESCISGSKGSGTIFFAGCNLDCIFCQNYDISQLREGKEITIRELASAMLYLQEIGCHNVNWVTPSHVVPQILESLAVAVENGFRLRIVYNSGGYDSADTLKLLEGIVDIYMPDFKYWDSNVAGKLSGASDYPEIARNALREMHRQVGDLVIDENGLALCGLLVRHLVLPDGLAGTASIMKFLAEEISPQTVVNIMAQYHPCFKAHEYGSLNQPLSYLEFLEARRQAQKAGITRFA